MTRERCYHCGHIMSTTGTPNSIEGYFISEVAIEYINGLIKKDERDLFDFLFYGSEVDEKRDELFDVNCIHAFHCKECGEICDYNKSVKEWNKIAKENE